MITSAGILKFMDFDKFYRNESEYLDVLCLLDLMMIVIVDRKSQSVKVFVGGGERRNVEWKKRPFPENGIFMQYSGLP